jgi:hypothetical protein
VYDEDELKYIQINKIPETDYSTKEYETLNWNLIRLIECKKHFSGDQELFAVNLDHHVKQIIAHERNWKTQLMRNTKLGPIYEEFLAPLESWKVPQLINKWRATNYWQKMGYWDGYEIWKDQDYIDKEKFRHYKTRKRKNPRFIFAECELLPEWAPAIKIKVRNKPKVRHTNEMKKEKNIEETKNQSAEENYLKNIISSKPDEAMSVKEINDLNDQARENVIIDQELDNDNPQKHETSELKTSLKIDSKRTLEK